jgi:hypothetical protein
MDGQHRKLAADKRSDITELPCLVFEVDDLGDEATGFIDINTCRGPLSSFHRFRAKLARQDADALAVEKVVTENGYAIAEGGGAKHAACVAALLVEYERDQLRNTTVFPRIFRLCAEILRGEYMDQKLFSTLCMLEHFLAKLEFGSLLDRNNHLDLLRHGPAALSDAMMRSANFYRKGGAKVWCQGIINLLNHRRRTRRIPDIMTSPCAEDD